jgi:hypothetical protein
LPSLQQRRHNSAHQVTLRGLTYKSTDLALIKL